MKKEDILVIDGDAADYIAAINLTAGSLFEKGYVKEDFASECMKREGIYPTGLPTQVPVAIPHCGSQFVNKESMCVLRLPKAVRFQRIDDIEQSVDTSLVFNLALKNDEEHVVFLQKFIMAFSEEGGNFAKECMEASREQVADLFEKYQII